MPPSKKPRLSPKPNTVPSLDQLEQIASNNNLNPLVTEILLETRKKVAELEGQLKMVKGTPEKPKKVGTEYSDPDPDDNSWWTTISQGQVGLEDDGVNKLELMMMRTSLRPPNCDPSAWPWGQKTFPAKVAYPQRAASLHLEHLQGAKKPHPATIFKAHSRNQGLKIKELLSKNGAPGQVIVHSVQCNVLMVMIGAGVQIRLRGESSGSWPVIPEGFPVGKRLEST